MKRSYIFAMIFIALFSCVFFSACGSKYKNLKMSFIDEDGKTLTQVSLMIDDQKDDAVSSLGLSVKFSGIKNKDIGNVSITCPQGIASVDVTSFTNGTYNFNVSALRSGVGEIKITHLASSKTATVDLIVNKKCSNLTPIGKTYIYSIPDSNTKTILLKDDLVNLFPVDSTDRIYYNFARTPNYSGLAYETEDITDDAGNKNTVIKSITISSAISDGTEVEIYPITAMDGYTNTAYLNKTVKLLFKKVLTDENVVLTTDEKHQPYIDAGETIHLIAKDDGVAADDAYEFAYLDAELKLKNDDSSLSLFDNGYMNFYSYSTTIEADLSSDKGNISVKQMQNTIQIYALDYTTNDVTVKIQLLPNSKTYAGELLPITKTLRVKGEIKPTSIEVSMAGKSLISYRPGQQPAPEGYYDLFDYYIANPNGFISENGFLFNFTPLVEDSFADLKGVQLTLNDESFAALEIYVYNRPIKFVSDGINNHRTESLTGLDLQNVYIKTKSGLSQNDNAVYSISISTISISELSYLEGISGCGPFIVYFRHAQGVDNIVLNAGSIADGGTRVDIIKDEAGNKRAEDVYLDINQATNVLTGTGAFVLYMDGDSSKIEGDSGAVSFANLDVSVENDFGANNPLLIKQYSVSDGDGLGVIDGGSTQISYAYNAQAGINNAIILIVYKPTAEQPQLKTDIGQYTIVFQHANGYRKEIRCLVYNGMTEDDLNILSDVDTKGNYAFENNDFRDEYSADYIVASGQNLNFQIDNSVLDANLNPKFDFPISFENEIGEDINEFVDKKSNINSLEIKFKKGTFIDGVCNIAVKFCVTVDSFSNILTKSETPSGYQIQKTFYVFEQIKFGAGGYDNDIILSDNSGITSNYSIQRYPNGLLGYYFNGKSGGEDLSRVDLTLQLRNADLWNYVLPMEQEESIFNVGTLSEGKLKVAWNSNIAAALFPLDQTDVEGDNNSATLSVQVTGTIANSTIVLTATLTQFKIVVPIRYTIYVSIPTISEQVAVASNYNINVADQEPYVNIKEGLEYELLATTSSSVGEPTRKNRYSVVVVDSFGNVVPNIVSGNKILITSNAANYKQLKAYIFALDALSQSIETATISNPSSFLMSDHKRAYFALDIIVSNGSRENPFLIVTPEDFWSLQSSQEDDGFYYTLMNNININTRNHAGQQIKNFNGHISSYANENKYIYTIYGIALNKEFKNLFETFKGTIDSVNFNVSYNYNFEISTSQKLGLIDQNYGNLTNVTLNISGENELNLATDNEGDMPTIYFGALVAENFGTIEYTSSDLVGVNGTINIKSAVLTYFGSVAGANYSTITGFSSTEEDAHGLVTYLSKNSFEYISNDPTIEFTVLLNNGGALADVEINANFSNPNSAIGGVIGLNCESLVESPKTNLKLENGFVTGKINARCNNVGGFIGKNTTTPCAISVELTSGYLSKIFTSEQGFKNLKSAMVLDIQSADEMGGENVGGIVGYDEGGHYYNCHYQIFEESALVGVTNVGGIAGHSRFGVFEFCSVMSYRWDYNALTSTFLQMSPDIKGQTNVGGIVGLTESNINDISGGGYNESVSNNLSAILYSSVNAYIRANENIGAIFASNSNSTIVFNAYFIGKLEMDDLKEFVDNANLNVSNDDANLVLSNYVYVVSEGTQAISFRAVDGENFDYHSTTNLEHWLYSSTVNGGYIYLTLDGSNPLFETSTDFTVSAKTGYTDTDGNPVSNLLHLEYFNFLIDKFDSSNNELVSALNERYNTKSILDLLNIAPTDENIKTEIRVGVTSSDPNVIRVVGDKLIVLKTGSCSINFFSAFNKKINIEIFVVVTTPVGDYVLKENENLNLSGQTLNLAKNNSKQVFASSSGYERYNGTTYQYQTTTNLYSEVTVECVAGEMEAGKTVADYISISGQNLVEGAAIVNPGDVLSVRVLDYLENGRFKITIKPYQIVEFNDGSVHKVKIDADIDPISFFVQTFQGPTDLHLNYHSAVLCPNNSMLVEAIVKTDLPLSSAAAQNLIESVQFKKVGDNDFTEVDNKNEYYTYLTSDNEYNAATKTQTIQYKITFKNLLDIQEEHIMRIWFAVNGGSGVFERYLDIVVCPELIDELDVKNYTYEVDDNYDIKYDSDGNPTIQENNILRPTGVGLIMVNVTPDNGFYNYLEIKDITGNEEIEFTQIDGILGHTMPELDERTADGLGIKIKKYNFDGFNKSILYISTQISELYSSKVHTVLITAYDLEDKPICSKQITINVKMTPSITMQYRDPNGILTDAAVYQNNYLYIANNVPADLIITPINSDGEVELLTTCPAGVTVQPITGNLYGIRFADGANLVGQTFEVLARTYATIEGKREYCDYTIINVKIVEFVVHNASISGSRVSFGDKQSTTERILDGTINEQKKIEFLFENSGSTKDISYLDGGNYFETTYRSSDTRKVGASGTLKAIYDILDELNNNTTDYVTLGKIDNNQFVAGGVPETDASLMDDGILVRSTDAKDLAIQVHFYLVLNGSIWQIQSSEPTETSVEYVEFEYFYRLNFTSSTSFIRPEVIKNEQDFLNMSSDGETNYILGNDLVLENYSPIDVNIASFDGNGRKIIIRSFAAFNQPNIDVGLFAHIYENMVVMNLVVVYDMNSAKNVSQPPLGYISPASADANKYYDLCNVESVDYQQVRFGGLTPYNEGVVTNCQVYGGVAFSASYIEQNAATNANNEINFYMAGMICENASTGRVTNSDSYLAMAGLVNISGFVYNNSGKIASSSYIANKTFRYGDTFISNEESEYLLKFCQHNSGYENLGINAAGYIFGKNESIETPINTFVTGFANSNSGEISMSYVDIVTGNFTAKDLASGFIYTNSGTIYDCYVKQDKFGDVGNTYSGFVQTNNGSISTCYTYINGGTWDGSTRNMFAPTLTQGISNCYEIVNVIPSYIQLKRIDGVTQIAPDKKSEQSNYAGFVFGDNDTAIWKLDGETPVLIATIQKVKYDGLTPSTDTNYYGLREVVRSPGEYVDDVLTYSFTISDNNYGIETNPYVIYNLQTWDWYFATATNSDGALKGSNFYYRIVCDIDFADTKLSTLEKRRSDDATETEYEFNGNIQGNNMEVQNILIYSEEARDAIGLFPNIKPLEGGVGSDFKYAITNLKITVDSIYATKTKAVGALAGSIQDYKLYNITVDTESEVIVGGNTVGGIAGIIAGNFEVEQVASNIGVNSTIGYSEELNVYSSDNLKDVFYAGSVFGIVDGGEAKSEEEGAGNVKRNINDTTYRNISKVSVNGNIVAIGNIVGSAFGFIGENVKLTDVNVNLSGSNLKGKYYSGGVIGENRGIVENVHIVAALESRIFTSTQSVMAGLVGLNASGFINNSSANVEIDINDNQSTIGGLVGRSVNGYINNSSFSGKLKGYITGGIIGAMADDGVLSSEPNVDDSIIYNDDENTIKPIDNVTISLDTINYWLENSSYFCTYTAGQVDASGQPDVFSAMNRKRVLGLCVGLRVGSEGDGLSIIDNYGYNSREKLLVFNGEQDIDCVGMLENATLQNGVTYPTPFMNVIKGIPVELDYICYITGATSSNLDWSKTSYSDEVVLLTNQNVNALTITKTVLDDESETQQPVKFYISASGIDAYTIYGLEMGNGTTYTLSWNVGYLKTLLGDDLALENGSEKLTLIGNTVSCEIEASDDELVPIQITFTNGKIEAEKISITYSFKFST